MKRSMSIPMLQRAAKLSLLSALFLCGTAVAQNTGIVEGVVVDGRNGLPLQGVSVYFGVDKGPHYEAQTDSTGGFRIAGIPNGDYGCHFEKSGYITQYSGSQNSAVKAVHVAGEDPVRISVSLYSYSKLSGRVLDPEGKPVVRAKVTLGPQDETTDDEGRFSFSQLSPGSYAIKAMPGRDSVVPNADHTSFKRVPGTPKRETPPGEERTELFSTWYPSAPAANLAEPVVIRGGDDLTDIDIRLRALLVHRVRGRAFNLDGSPMHLGTVTTYSQADLVASASIVSGKAGGGGLGYFTLSRSAAMPSADDGLKGVVRDGSFELASVPRGVREFRAEPRDDLDQLREQMDRLREQMEEAKRDGVPLATKLAASRPAVISVSPVVSVVVDHDIDDLEIRTEPAITIDATVGLADTPPENTPEAVRNARVSLNGLSPLAMPVPGKRTGNSFEFGMVTPGEIRVAAPPGVEGRYYLASVSLGGQDVMWKPVKVHAGSAPISVTYKPNAATVTGVAESAEAGEVVLIPQEALDSVDVQYGRLVSLAAGGAFRIDSVGPGQYYAFATAHFQPEKLSNPTFAGRIAAAAIVVSITEGTTISIKPPLVRPDM